MVVVVVVVGGAGGGGGEGRVGGGGGAEAEAGCEGKAETVHCWGCLGGGVMVRVEGGGMEMVVWWRRGWRSR